jgi:High potential iron-sulfur protein
MKAAMKHSSSRRQMLRSLAVAAGAFSLVRLGPARAASQPLLAPGSQAAQKVGYVEDAKGAKGASPGSSCANCALYQGASGSSQGPCQLFPNNDVKAGGWCSSWAAQM